MAARRLDPLRQLERLGYGNELGVVPFRLGPKRLFLVTRPEDIGEVMHMRMPPLSRGPTAGLAHWFGSNVFTNEGPEHDHERELWKRLFYDEIPPSYAAAAVENARRVADVWSDGEPVEAYDEMKRIRRATDWRVLTDGDLERDSPELVRHLDVGFAAHSALLTPFARRYWSGPLPASRRLRAARAAVDERIDALAPRGAYAAALAARNSSGLLRTQDAVRGWVKTFLVANQFDTILAWTWYLLARNGDAQLALHEELARELPDRDPDASDLERLPYTSAVVKESMRVLPPAWILVRGVAQSTTVGGHAVPRGALLVFSPWVTHRDGRLWREPLSFRPERWLNGESDAAPPFSYFPQSGGHYGCVGTRIVETIAPLVVATVARRWRLSQPDGAGAVRPRPKFLLEPAALVLVPKRQSGGRAG